MKKRLIKKMDSVYEEFEEVMNLQDIGLKKYSQDKLENMVLARAFIRQARFLLTDGNLWPLRVQLAPTSREVSNMIGELMQSDRWHEKE